MDIRELCNVLLKEEMISRKIPPNEANSYLAAGAKAFANNAPEVVTTITTITTNTFNPFMGIALLLKTAKDFEGEIAVSKKLDTLIASSYKDGLEHLKIAESASFDNTRKYELSIASQRFLTASTVERPLIAAKAKFLAGVCYELLGEKDTALGRYKEAYEEGQQEIIERLKKLALIKKAVFRSGILGAATMIAPHAGSLAFPLALLYVTKITKGVLAGKTAEEFQIEVAAALTQLKDKTTRLKDKTLKLTDGVVDSLRAKEIQEIEEFQGNFLVPLSALLSRDGTKLILQ